MTDLDNLILKLIEDGPIKGVELAALAASKVHGISPDEFDAAVKRLITEHKITEVEYVLPQMDYRVKSMFFPKGTTFKVLG